MATVHSSLSRGIVVLTLDLSLSILFFIFFIFFFIFKKVVVMRCLMFLVFISWWCFLDKQQKKGALLMAAVIFTRDSLGPLFDLANVVYPRCGPFII